MKAFTEIIQKISDTQQAMRKLAALLSKNPSRLSLQSSYESLQKRHEVLEAKFLSLSNQNQLDVCSYRVFSEIGENYPIFAFGSALRDFQKWFSTIYDALKTGPKKRARLSPEILTESTLNFAFSFPGSVGVAMTIPSERMLFENDLQLAMIKTTEMLKAEGSDQVHYFAKQLGAASVRALYCWVEDHVNAGLGVDIHWVSNEKPISEIIMGFEKMKNLKQAIEETSDLEEATLEVQGWLVGADTSSHTFHMVFEEDREIRGTMSEAVGASYTVELPQFYIATIKKTSFVNYATGEEKTTYFLESLKKI